MLEVSKKLLLSSKLNLAKVSYDLSIIGFDILIYLKLQVFTDQSIPLAFL